VIGGWCGLALPRPIALCLFRVAQEALRNAISHAHAQQVTLRMRLSTEQALVTAWRDMAAKMRIPKRMVKGNITRRCLWPDYNLFILSREV